MHQVIHIIHKNEQVFLWIKEIKLQIYVLWKSTKIIFL